LSVRKKTQIGVLKMDSLKAVVPYAKRVFFYALSIVMASALFIAAAFAQGDSSLWG
jgi:hypothetical protein